MHLNSLTCICQFKKFSGVIPRSPVSKEERREYRREGGITMNGRKGMGKKDKGAGKGG
jgi:hypothetical protein